MKAYVAWWSVVLALGVVAACDDSGAPADDPGDDDPGDDDPGDDGGPGGGDLPPLGDPVENSAGFPVTRLTDRSSGGGFGTHAYSQLQAFSPDGEYVLLIENEVYGVRRLDDLSLVEGIDSSGWNAPRWDPSLPHAIVHYDSNEDTTIRVQHTDAESLVVSTAFTFPTPYERIRGNQSFDELSRDGLWLAGMASQSGDINVIFTLNLETGEIEAELPLPDLFDGTCDGGEFDVLEPDWVAVSPLGNYLVVQWVRDGTDRCSGLETFDIETGEWIGRVTDRHAHGDLGVRSDGTTECFMTFELAHEDDNNRDGIGLRDLPGDSESGEAEHLSILNFNGDHISCQGPYGQCLVTTRTTDDGGPGGLFLQNMDNTTVDLGEHGSTGCGYWTQPRGSFSADGNFAIYASDLGSGANCEDGEVGSGEAYLVDLSSL